MYVINRYLIKKAIVCIKINNKITSSQLAQGPELGFIKISNSMFLIQNIYVINRHMCFLIMYNKAWKRKGNTKYIIWYLLNKLS